MMTTTHALASAVLGAAVWVLVPEAGMLPVLMAVLGDLFPDLDLYAGRRKILHFPVYFSALAMPAVAVATLNPMITTFAVALLLAVAALHSASDVPGGGLELKPWLGISEYAVYGHWNGQWFALKRPIRYDDTPEGLALTLAFAIPPVLAFDGLAEALVIDAVTVFGVYVLLRKPMAAIAETAVAVMPDHVIDLMPERPVRDFR